MVASQSGYSRLRVIIAGGGVAGLTLANALQLAGIDFVVLEARAEIAPQLGAGIAVTPNGARILDQIGCFGDILDMIEPIRSEASHFESGDYVQPRTDGLPLLGKRLGYPIAVLERRSLLEVLYNHINDKRNVLVGKRISKVNHSEDKVVVYCDDDSSFEGDVLAGADGVNSKARHEMWRLADELEPGRISEKEKTSMFAEYCCLFGISSNTEGMEKGWFDIIYSKGTSTISWTGKSGRVCWFVFQKMDQIHPTGKIPKFTKEDAYAFGEANSEINFMPNGSVKLRDLWKNRVACTLAPLEEAEYDTWTWGRVACIGDGVHKTTPNAGAGGNAAIESAAALANSVTALSNRSEQKRPTLAEVKRALMDYQQNRRERMSAVLKITGSFTRLEALDTFLTRIMAHHIFPRLGDYGVEIHSDIMIGATMLNYLPTPTRSLQGTMPFNPDQGAGKKESKFLRALLALPFLLVFTAAVSRMNASTAIEIAEGISQKGKIVWDSGSLPVREAFYHIRWLDNLLRPITIIFAQWNLGYDGPGSWQTFSFLTDFGLLYSIFLIESARRANLCTFAQIPTLFGLLAQLLGIGVVGPLYFFLYYLATPIENFRASDNRLTDLSYTRSILPAMMLCYYIPHYLSNLSPSLDTRHSWNWVWQIFPIWVTLFQWLAAHTVMPNTVKYDRIHATERDLPTIRFTIGSLVALSTAVWVYTLSQSPFSLSELFVPQLEIPQTLVENMRNFIQHDLLFSFGSALLWLGYLFHDMKNAGMVDASWIRIIAMAALTTFALGPGAAVGLGWLWREQMLATKRHKSALVQKA